MDTPLLDTLARRVGYLREHSGLEQTPLSKRCGLSASHIGQIIRGDVKKPAPETLVLIARAFRVSLEWLMTGDGPPPKPEDVAAAIGVAEHTASDFAKAAGE
jgi:transcriptional regulator with XRE-family HTH domain